MALLSGCGTALSDPASVCPPVIQYSPEFLARAADDLDRLPDGSAIGQMMIDYQRERDQLRECQ